MLTGGANFMEDSDDSKAMDRQDIETDSEECHSAEKYHDDWRKQVESYHDLERKCCSKCNQGIRGSELEHSEFGRRRTRRTKDQLQHCPSCHYPLETVKYSVGKTNCSKNVDAVLDVYEKWLTNPSNQTFKESQGNTLSPRLCCVSPCNNDYAYYHSRKRQSSSHRCQCRNKQDQMLSIMKSTLRSAANDGTNACYDYPRSVKNSYKKEDYWRDDQMVSEFIRTMDVNESETAENYTQHKKERGLRLEPRSARQRVEKTNKLNANERHELGDHEDDDWLPSRGRLKFDLSKYENAKNAYSEGVEDDRRKQGKKKANVLSNKFSILKPCGSHVSSKNKNVEGLDPPASPDKESTSNKEESREDTCCELTVKDDEQEAARRKGIFAGGDLDLDLDLDLHATKSYIVELIDQVLSKKFANTPDQQKNIESNRGLTEQGFCIEIIRALHGNCCEHFPEDLLSHRETTAEYIKRLKILRTEYMKQIQNEFRRLCDLQQFLDKYSPRQSLSAFQSHPDAVEQRTEERQQQQQHEEKQNFGTIS